VRIQRPKLGQAGAEERHDWSTITTCEGIYDLPLMALQSNSLKLVAHQIEIFIPQEVIKATAKFIVLVEPPVSYR
jgi:hypothetical protein